MKTFISLALVVIFSVSGCTDFITSGDREESRASRPSPADISTKTKSDEPSIMRDSSKSAPSLPSNK